jgi:hypothetical protein
VIFTTLAVLLFNTMSTQACKSAKLGDVYPIHDFSPYSHVVIVRVTAAEQDTTHRYSPLVSFEASVVDCLKGNLETGETFRGRSKREQPYAVCPTHLSTDGTYLLLLSKTMGKYVLSRFSFPVHNGHENYDKYIVQIKTALGK